MCGTCLKNGFGKFLVWTGSTPLGRLTVARAAFRLGLIILREWILLDEIDK